MFGRRSTAEYEALEPEHLSAPPPPRERRPAEQSRIFTTGRTFAERRAQAEANNAARATQRLVSLGPTEFTQRDRKTGRVEYVDAELFMDLDHPRERFVRLAGDANLHPLVGDSRRDEVTPLPSIGGRVRLNQQPLTRDPAPPDPPVRSVSV